MASLEADFEDGDPARWDLDRLAKLGTEENLELANAGLEDWAGRCLPRRWPTAFDSPPI